MWLSRSSRREVFCKKVFLRNFTKFTGKHLCQSLAKPQACNFLRPWHSCFLVNFCEISRSTLFYRIPLAAASILALNFSRKILNATLYYNLGKYSQGKLFYSIQYMNGWLAAFDLFDMFAQSIKFYYKFPYHLLRVQMFGKFDSCNWQEKWMVLLPAIFTAKFLS